MKKLWAEFIKFIKRGNVIDMAVGVAVASAFTAIVTAFTKGFISPLLALLTGESDMASMKWVIREQVLADDGVTVEVAEVAVLWGAFIQTIIDFLIIALALFIVMKVAAAMRERALKLHEEVKSTIMRESARAEKAEADQTTAEADPVAAEEEEEKPSLEQEMRERELRLLEEIRDLLKQQNEKE